MMRRYSRPRTFRPGWTRPSPRVRFAAGLTTMPSPPASVRSCHHWVAAAGEAGASGWAAAGWGGGGGVAPGRGRAEPVGDVEVPQVRVFVVDLTLGGQELERGDAHPGE